MDDVTQPETEAPRPSPGEAAVRDTAPEPRPIRFGTAGALTALLAGLALAMHEVSDLCAGFITDDGRYASPGMFAGPLAAREVDRWNDPLTFPDALEKWQAMFGLYQVGKLALVAVLAAVTLLVARRIRARHPSTRLRRVPVVVLLGSLVLLSLAEFGLHAYLSSQRCTAGGCVDQTTIWLAVAVTYLKCAVVAALLVAALVLAWRASGRQDRSRWEVVQGVWVQRFSLLAFLPIAILAVLPLGKLVYDVFDQLPDVQRAWLNDGSPVRDLVASGLVFGGLVLPAIFFLGRSRARFAATRARIGPWWPYFDEDPETNHSWDNGRRQQLWFWLLGPAVLLVLGLLIDAGSSGTFYWRRWAGFTAVAVVVIGTSYVLRYVHGGLVSPRRLADRGAAFVRDVLVTGDIVAVASLSLTGLGLVRAFTAPTVLAHYDLLDVDHDTQAWQVGLAAVGLVSAVACWPLASLLLRQKPFLHRPDSETSPRVRDGLTLVLGLASTAGFLLLCWQPQWVGTQLGALGAATLALGTLTVMLGVVVAYAQRRQPPELFQLRLRKDQHSQEGRDWRFRATPVVALLIVGALVAQAAGDTTDVHPVSGGAPIPDRKSLAEAFDDWLAADDPCTVPYAEDPAISVRPMLLFAAEGGGIRAAYWTASALARISSAGGSQCARRSALFSAGASGGAVGLTLARFSEDPRAAVQAITGPDALAQAATSLMSSDLLTSAAGIRFESDADSRGVGTREELDRAGLMEVEWEDSIGETLQRPYLTDDLPTSGTGAVTGHLILTTTVAWNGCRALLSQVDLGGDTTITGQPTDYAGEDWPVCGSTSGAAGPNSYDLFDAYGLREGDDTSGEAEHCLGNIHALTGALLASRFPYVTPSGVIGPCAGADPNRDLSPTQLIDGGYSDNTGLGTIVDTARVWGGLVAKHNSDVLNKGSGALVVPVVVYLENGTGTDYTVVGDAALDDDEVAAEREDLSEKGGGRWASPPWRQQWGVPEVIIPPVGYATAGNHKVETAAWLQKAQWAIYDSLCNPGSVDDPAECERLLASQQFKPRVYVVNQRPQPSTPAPLGWVLSSDSQAEMTADLDFQEKTPRVDLSRKYGTLYDLETVLGLRTPPAQ